jgi:hypothetical protein
MKPQDITFSQKVETPVKEVSHWSHPKKHRTLKRDHLSCLTEVLLYESSYLILVPFHLLLMYLRLCPETDILLFLYTINIIDSLKKLYISVKTYIT